MKVSYKEISLLFKYGTLSSQNVLVKKIKSYIGDDYKHISFYKNFLSKINSDNYENQFSEVIEVGGEGAIKWWDNPLFIDALVNTPECELNYKKLYNYKLDDETYNTKTSLLEDVEVKVEEYKSSLDFNKSGVTYQEKGLKYVKPDVEEDHYYCIFLPDTQMKITFDSEDACDDSINTYTELMGEKFKKQMLKHILEEIEIKEEEFTKRAWKTYNG